MDQQIKATTTAQFMGATNVQKEILLIDGLKFISEQMKESADNMKRLNAWLRCFNGLCSFGELDVVRAEELKKLLSELTDNFDTFTAHAMVNSLLTTVTDRVIDSHLKVKK